MESVTDQLYLSIWLERHAQATRFRHYQTLLKLFPFSQREQPQSTVTIQAVNLTEPPLLERALNGPVQASELDEIFIGYSGPDIAYEVESWWDVWQQDVDWQIRPARVSLSCFGLEFDNGTERPSIAQEDLRIDFGVDSYFLPDVELSGSARMVESNIKSLLRLVHEIESTLPVAERRLETESGENFATRLQHILMPDSARVS